MIPGASTTTTDIAMLPRPLRRLRAGPVLMIAGALALSAVPTIAQNALPMTPRNALPSTPQDVEARALRDQVQELGQRIADARVLLAETVRNQVPPTVAAQLEVRLSDLEAEVRGLTGRIEELDFGMRKMNERLDKAMADMEFRISELEDSKGTGGKKTTKTAKNAKAAEAKSADDARADGASGSSGAEHPGGGANAKPPEVAMAKPGPISLPPGSETDQYQFAMAFLRKGQYEQASSALAAFVAAHPKGQLASNAVYWLGESYYARGMFDQAAVRFAEGYQKYPDGAKGPDSLLKLGMSLGRLNKRTEACTSLAELRRKFPDAPANIQSGANAARERFGCR
jgi:tol-pal system protein YbgF